jgi:hypothetical protein
VVTRGVGGGGWGDGSKRWRLRGSVCSNLTSPGIDHSATREKCKTEEKEDMA